MSAHNREIRPVGEHRTADFALVEIEVADPAVGQALVRNLLIPGADRLSDRPGYRRTRGERSERKR